MDRLISRDLVKTYCAAYRLWGRQDKGGSAAPEASITISEAFELYYNKIAIDDMESYSSDPRHD